MAATFTIDLLPAQRGDCLWLTYGEGADLHHVLIDGGPQDTITTVVGELERRIKALPGRTNRVELLVVTHVDADHVQGIVSLMSDHSRLKLFRDVWFNGFQHLMPGLLGGPDGERLTRALETDATRWNAAFAGGPVSRPATGPLPKRTLTGGLELIVLGPGGGALERLAPTWEKECRRARLLPGQGADIVKPSWRRDELLGFDIDALAQAPVRADPSKANASSITMIATFGRRRILLLGDAVPKEVIAGLERIGPGPHKFDAVKLAHHGSRNNTNLDLLSRIRAKHWLVSTNGATFKHPNLGPLAQVIVTQHKPNFVLNYVTPFVEELISHAGDRYTVTLPKKQADGTFVQGVSHRI